MSSPAIRNTRRNPESATPRRSARSSQAALSSPLGQVSDERLPSETSQREDLGLAQTGSRAGNEAHSFSPLFSRSSSNVNGGVRPGTNEITTSSPLRQRSGMTDNNATPRPSGLANGDSSPLHYGSSSSVVKGQQRREPRSSSSNLFVRSTLNTDALTRRHDINSDINESSAGRRRRLFVDENGMPVNADRTDSDAATFSNLDPNTSDADILGGNSSRVIWGTNLSISDAMGSMKDFLRHFQKKYRMISEGLMSENEHIPEGHPGNDKEYVEMMKLMLQLGVTALNLDAKNLKAYPPTRKLWHQLQAFPNEIIPLMDVAIKDEMLALAQKQMDDMRMSQSEGTTQQTQSQRIERNTSSIPPLPSSDVGEIPGEDHTQPPKEIPDLFSDVDSKIYRVRPFGLDRTINLRDLNPSDMDKLVSVKGLVIRTTPIIPDMKDAFFRCAVCNHTTKVSIDRGKIAEPTVCPRPVCESANSMQIVHNRSGFSDKQVIKLQETPDNVPDGQTPHSVSLCAYDDLVDVCKAGDRVEITGIFKCNQVRVNPRQRTVKNIFKTYVDVLHIQKIDKHRLGVDVNTVEEELSEHFAGDIEETRKISEEDEARIKTTAARPDVYELLARSLAPSIYEMDDVKKGILLQLFGGTNKSFDKGGSPKYRGDINILLCGDPSTSKSQLLTYVHKIAPRGVYTSGKGSSAVGLTAYVTRDPETRQLVLESGALVLSDGGVCCIDEFDKMSDSTRSVLHEVMEQQTVSIAKAGIITTLNARTSILASANPIGSKYNPNLPVPQNIDLPPTLLSRFDLVYLVLDKIDEQDDRRLARHLVGMYLEDSPENASAQEILPIEFLTSYITYARANLQPVLSEAASVALVEAYVSMRSLGADVRASERRITATTRQLESMVRLAEAHAKMRLSGTVEASDVQEACRLIQSALKQAATDSRTGLIDMSLLTEGTSASERQRKEDLKKSILGIVDDLSRSSGNASMSDITRKLAQGSAIEIEPTEVVALIRSMETEGFLQTSGEGGRKSVRRIVGVA